MIRLAISVEGPTEEEFVKNVLADYLSRRGIYTTPILLGRARGGSNGGNVSMDRLVAEMAYLLRSFDAVTSFVDFYGFSGKGDKTVDDLEKDMTRQMRKKLGRRWYPEKVFPYVQQYEFEGLLFSNVDAFVNAIDASEDSVEELRSIRVRFPTPEDINDNSETAPSKRIVKIITQYDKRLYGPLIAMEIGLETIRAECPRFSGWMTRLESLTSKD